MTCGQRTLAFVSCFFVFVCRHSLSLSTLLSLLSVARESAGCCRYLWPAVLSVRQGAAARGSQIDGPCMQRDIEVS